jgi:HK97 family phage major capsid protein
MPFKHELTEKAQLGEIRSKMLEAGEYLTGLRTKPAESRDAGWQDDVRSATDFIHGWDPVITAMERGHASMPADGGGPVGATALVFNEERRTAGDLFTNDEKYTNFASRHQAGATFAEVEVRGSLLADNHEVRQTISSNTNSGTGDAAGVWRAVGTPMPPRGIRQTRLFIRDVITVQGTGLASVPYIRELTPVATELGASSVGEGQTKPEVTMLFEQDDAPVRKIAAWIPATEEIIDDAPTLRGYIDTRLAYLLAMREELQILFGSGAAPQLKGILNFSGVQTQAAVNAEVPATLAAAIGLVENVDGEADCIVMNPIKYWTAVSTRFANQMDGVSIDNLPFGDPTRSFWGLPVIRTRVLATTQAVVGSWRMGATLFDKAQTTIRVGNQHNDFFITNKIAILAEERVALAVHRPDFFVNVTLP